MENMDDLLMKVSAKSSNCKEKVCTIMLSYQLFNMLWSMPSEEKCKKSNVVSKSSHTEAMTCVLQIVTFVIAEKGMEHKEEQR